MSLDEQQGTLDRIADILESRTLSDREILEVQSWRQVVQPATRPFLERVCDALGARDAMLYQAQPANRKRRNFDILSVKTGDLWAFVAVGWADVPDGELSRSLSWGLYAWGKSESVNEIGKWLRSLPEQGFTLRGIHGVQAGDFGGISLLLYRALSPAELRQRDEYSLVGEISDDLRRLMEHARSASQAPRLMPAPSTERPLSAEALSDWLRSTHGLFFAPYQVAAFVTALQAKGFVILSGLSGTGKTQLAVRIAELVHGSLPSVIPVRPDWRDGRSLLGYYNPISERYASTELLRQLLPDQDVSPPLPPSGAIDLSKVRDGVALAEQEGWTPDLRKLVERLEHADSESLTMSDLELIWRQRSNGVASIGQAMGVPLVADEEELREATALLVAAGTPGERLIRTLRYFHNRGNPWHWARVLRALAIFDLDRTSTVVHRDALAEVLMALGYGRSFDLARLVRRDDHAHIDEALAFLRRRVDELFPDFDRFQKAVAPWYIYTERSGTAPVVGTESDLAVARHRFIILDEMNLARVEYYFAEFLSVLESDRDEAGFTMQAVPLHAESKAVRDGPVDDPTANDIPSELRLPPHLYVVGTVNTDETTHAFSPKVLDRAFTIEFNDVDLTQTGRVGPGHGPPMLAPELARLLAASAPIAGREAMERAMREPLFLEWLGSLYRLLRPYDLHFGFRPRDEIARFVGYAIVSPLADGFSSGGKDRFEGAFDAAVLMKVLPKFHGPRAKLSGPLTSVLSWAISPMDFDDVRLQREADIGRTAGSTSESLLRAGLMTDMSGPVLPRVADKAARMLHEVTAVGFTTFS